MGLGQVAVAIDVTLDQLEKMQLAPNLQRVLLLTICDGGGGSKLLRHACNWHIWRLRLIVSRSATLALLAPRGGSEKEALPPPTIDAISLESIEFLEAAQNQARCVPRHTAVAAEGCGGVGGS